MKTDAVLCRYPCRSSHSVSSRQAFTLVELLVVVLIVGMLVALIAPAVMQARAKARTAAIKAEIDMLHMAMMNYKNEYGSFPPCVSGTAATDLAAKHVARLFPRCTSGPSQLASAFPSTANPKTITSTNAISYWLSGYTDDPTAPLISSGLSRKKLYDFDMSRVNQTTGAYFPSGKSSSPYLYIDSKMYTSVPYAGGSSASAGAFRVSFAGDPTPFANTAQAFANSDTFQILCAGSDEIFGNDDDLSNFWPGTRKDYLDSLNQ